MSQRTKWASADRADVVGSVAIEVKDLGRGRVKALKGVVGGVVVGVLERCSGIA
ncbi:MAG: hypothetical protein DHS20C16_22210 [Phycisphaerae bacterium]|nr:MAG: hypothetical protein DHS20C16_22210 [Phycisphaerae bacterium]